MERKFNFYNVTYEYLKDDYPALYHSLDELTGREPLKPAPEDSDDPIRIFNEDRRNLTKDLTDILRIFSIEDYREDFKHNGKYQLNEYAVQFFATLLTHYNKTTVWKKDIKHVLNYTLDKRNFIQLCQQSQDPVAFAEEVNFAARGFLDLHNALDNVSATRKQAFHKALLIATQYPTLNLQAQCIQISHDICAYHPAPEDVTQSINGELLMDYNYLLDQVTEKLKLLANEAHTQWDNQKIKRQAEYYQWLQNSPNMAINNVIERVKKYVAQKHPDYSLTDDFEIVPKNVKSDECKELRKETSAVRATLQEALWCEFHEHKAEFDIFAKHYHLIP